MADSNSPLRITLVSPEPDLILWLFSDLGLDAGDDPVTTQFSGRDIEMTAFDTEAEPPSTSPQILLGLIRFVDVLSLQKMEELIHAIPHADSLPTTILIYRNENEQDFKMSCPYCGQKLWVRDADLDKRGRCPHCRKGFTLPEQEAHVRSVLRLQDAVPVHRVERGDSGSLAAPLRSLVNLKQASVLDKLDAPSNFKSNQTMNVDIEVEED
jgi:hypothetical protein